MHTQPLHLLPFKCTMFPRSPCDSGDCICGLPAFGSLSLAFMLAQSLMWSDQTLIQIPSSASGYTESQANMGNSRVHIGKCASVCWILYLFDQKLWNWKGLPGDSLMIPVYVCNVSASNNSDCNMIVKGKALFMCLCAHILNHGQKPVNGLAYDDWMQ